MHKRVNDDGSNNNPKFRILSFGRMKLCEYVIDVCSVSLTNWFLSRSRCRGSASNTCALYTVWLIVYLPFLLAFNHLDSCWLFLLVRMVYVYAKDEDYNRINAYCAQKFDLICHFFPSYSLLMVLLLMLLERLKGTECPKSLVDSVIHYICIRMDVRGLKWQETKQTTASTRSKKIWVWQNWRTTGNVCEDVFYFFYSRNVISTMMTL